MPYTYIRRAWSQRIGSTTCTRCTPSQPRDALTQALSRLQEDCRFQPLKPRAPKRDYPKTPSTLRTSSPLSQNCQRPSIFQYLSHIDFGTPLSDSSMNYSILMTSAMALFGSTLPTTVLAQGGLNVSAISTANNASVLECWSLSAPSFAAARAINFPIGDSTGNFIGVLQPRTYIGQAWARQVRLPILHSVFDGKEKRKWK